MKSPPPGQLTIPRFPTKMASVKKDHKLALQWRKNSMNVIFGKHRHWGKDTRRDVEEAS